MDRYGIEVSAHAPYYTNFANPDREMADKSIGYVLQSLAAVRRMGGERVVVHPAAQGKAEREAAVAEAERNFHRLAEALADAGDCKICLETLGKIRQVGRVEEVLRFCKISDRFYPCFDFGHINCYTMGGIRTKDDYRRIIDASFDALGEEKTRNMHVHFSKIAYGAGGESHHPDVRRRVVRPRLPSFGRTDRRVRAYAVCRVRIGRNDGRRCGFNEKHA